MTIKVSSSMMFAGAAGLALVIVIASFVPGPYAAVVTPGAAGSAQFQGARLDPAAVKLLQRACQNCHSQDTEWPLYSKLAPVSWMIRKDVSEGRKFLNFSQWSDYGANGQSQLLALSADQIRSGAMPPQRYLILHPEAKLSDSEKTILFDAMGRESQELLRRH